jgi:hypothetical protein
LLNAFRHSQLLIQVSPSGAVLSLFCGLAEILNKDSTAWLDGATLPTPVSLSPLG